MKTILAPVDFSETTDAVVREAADLACALNARFVLLTVIQPSVAGGVDAMPAVVLQKSVEMTDRAERSAGRKLARIVAKLKEKQVCAEAIHEVGTPLGVILEKAEELSATYVVVGSHGHSAFYDLIAGSVAQGLLRRAKCPVLVVPAEKKVSGRVNEGAVARGWGQGGAVEPVAVVGG